MNLQALKDNLQHVAGVLIGLTVLRWTGRRFSKADRGARWFSTVGANLAANSESLELWPYRSRTRHCPGSPRTWGKRATGPFMEAADAASGRLRLARLDQAHMRATVTPKESAQMHTETDEIVVEITQRLAAGEEVATRIVTMQWFTYDLDGHRIVITPELQRQIESAAGVALVETRRKDYPGEMNLGFPPKELQNVRARLEQAERRGTLAGDDPSNRELGFIKPDTATHVFFYEQDYYVLSNFSAFRVEWAGRDFDTSEAAYHYEKFVHGDEAAQQVALDIYLAPSAHEAFKIAESKKALRRPDWDDVKVDVMRGILRAKVSRHEYVRRKLLATGERELVEDSWRDGFWGWGSDRGGQNVLGKLWMELRAEIRASDLAMAVARDDVF